jgi:hypothetical protein
MANLFGGPAWGAPPPPAPPQYNMGAPPPPMFVPGAAAPPPPRPPANGGVEIPPETLRLAKRLGYLNILLSMFHLASSVAIIGLIRYNLEDYSVAQVQGSRDVALSYTCLMAAAPAGGGGSGSVGSGSSSQCSYAYTTAAGSGAWVHAAVVRRLLLLRGRPPRCRRRSPKSARKRDAPGRSHAAPPPPHAHTHTQKHAHSPRLLHPVPGAVPHARLRRARAPRRGRL